MYETRRPDPRPALPGFESRKRVWDAQHDRYAVKISPGGYYVTNNDEMLVTVLGSCVAACIRDTKIGVGGMNHFMLPVGKDRRDDVASDGNRYGNYAMENLINSLLKQGATRGNLEVKIFGGARILNSGTDIGGSNLEFVRRYLTDEKLSIVAEDTAGTNPRKVLYFPASGRARVRRVRSVRAHVEATEKRYLDDIQNKPVAGEIELFS